MSSGGRLISEQKNALRRMSFLVQSSTLMFGFVRQFLTAKKYARARKGVAPLAMTAALWNAGCTVCKRLRKLEVQEFGNSSTMMAVGDHVEAKVVSVRTSVDPKATAAERALTIVPFWLAMFLRYTTVVSIKVGIMRTGRENPSGCVWISKPLSFQDLNAANPVEKAGRRMVSIATSGAREKRTGTTPKTFAR